MIRKKILNSTRYELLQSISRLFFCLLICNILGFESCAVCLLSACGVTIHCEEEEEEKKRRRYAYKGHRDLFLLQLILLGLGEITEE